MLTAALGMVLLTRIGVDTAYATHVLPSLILIGIGFGLTIAPSFVTATHGVPAHDSGIASAMVSTSQQIGGSIGAALLSTLAAAAATPVDGYTTAFAWAAAILAGGAVLCGSLLRSSTRPEASHGPGAEPVAA
jgi:sugar phosphate permease